MNTYTLFFVFSMLLMNMASAAAQVFAKPEYDIKRSAKELTLHRVEVNKKYTICEISYKYDGRKTEDPDFIYIIPDMHIIDIKTGEKFYVIKSENIPMYPRQYEFKQQGEVLRFRVYFPAIDPKKTIFFNILEEVDRGFKFFTIHLYPVA